MHFQVSLTLAFAAIAAFEVCAQSDNSSSSQSILQILQTNSETSKLYATLQKNSLSNLGFLDGSDNGTYTVFAPSNAAFTPQVLALLPTVNNLNDLLRYHVLNGSYTTENLQDGPNIVDTLASNGTILKWSNATGLPLNVFKNSSGIQLHSGFGNATVVTTDIKAKNGVIHLIDGILNYPQSPSATIKASDNLDKKILSQFYGALYRLELIGTIDDANGQTIFAPNDDAFAGMDLLSMSNDTLSSIIKYHIVNNVYYTTNFTNSTQPVTVSTLNNTSLNITKSDDTIAITNGTADAKVVIPNVLTNNGVIHVVNKVLYPPNNTYSNTLAGNNVTNNSTNNPTATGKPNGAPSTHISQAAVMLSIVAVVSTLFF